MVAAVVKESGVDVDLYILYREPNLLRFVYDYELSLSSTVTCPQHIFH